MLYYKDQIVDVKYFKVRFVTDMPDATYDVTNSMKIGENFNVATGTVVDVNRSITWANLYNNVLKDKVAHQNVTPQNFCSYYDVTIESKRGNVTIPNLFSFNSSTYNGTSASNANMKKLALQLDYTNAYLALLTNFGQTQTFTTTVTFTPNEANSGLYPTITVTYVLTVENPLSFKPELGEYNDITWFPKNITMNGVDYNNIITQYAVPSDPKFAAAGEHPSYKTNILTGRTAPYVYFPDQEAKDSLDNIATWTTSVLPMKKGVNDVYRAATTDGETSYVGGEHANEVRSTYFDIEHNAEGIEMVSNQFAMIVNWGVYPIGHYNYAVQNAPITFAQTGVQIVKPLTLAVNNEAVAPIIDNKQTTTNLLDAITVTDYYGNVVISRVDGVAKVQYRDFYGFGESIVVDYDTEGIPIDGKTPESMKYSITISSQDLKVR
ncbi:MAG: hypothetical protein K2M76_07380, partial [Muribaculaceae bacterium]|nr:hypothetical protein [Muribaculaceae bacterium]